MDTILSARNLHFKNIIDYPQIEIQRNLATFICGESGSGKSTLLRLFNSMVSPSAGEIKYEGQNIEGMDTVRLRKEVMLVSQIVFLFNGTIKECFKQYYDYREVSLLTVDDMKKYLFICGADFDLDSDCETMSGGERQRVFIAICLSFLPKILMLDEPTSSLDAATSNRFFENIKTFCNHNNITLIIISHDKTLTDKFADNKILLEKRVDI